MVEVSIPHVKGEQHQLTLDAGKTVFVLGPNGAGKSSLLQHLANQFPDHLVKWIRAHRRSWMNSNVLELTPLAFRTQQRHHEYLLRQPDARYLIHDDGFDTQSALASLVQKQNADGRKIKQLLMQGEDDQAKDLAKEDVLHTLNSALQRSDIPVAISIFDEDDIFATKYGSTYGVNQMSDGERSVILLAASILTAKGGTQFLIDEPERHLHRAIISPLLSTLFEARPDCGFVISTHEVSLPVDDPDADVVLVRECHLGEGNPTTWDFDVVKATQDIPEPIRMSILGARREIVFVEGEQSSPDYPLYACVLPNVSIVPIGGNRSVKSAVRSIRSSSSFHAIRAFGIVDRDYLDEYEIQTLERNGVFVVDGYAVESIYYDINVQRMVVERNANAERVCGRLDDAKERALRVFCKSAGRLSRGRAEARRRKMVLSDLEKTDLAESKLQLRGGGDTQGREEQIGGDDRVSRPRGLDQRVPCQGLICANGDCEGSWISRPADL